MKTLDQVKPIANDLRETEHTPGPWRADEWATGWSVGSVKAQYTVCVLNDLQNPERNARLIAAAPELLAVLERFIALGKSGADTSWYSDDAQDTFYAMMRAIGTAKGEI